jgi:hypothetical protein
MVVAGVFEGWLSAVAFAKRNGAILSQAVRRVVNMQLGSAFLSWHEWAVKSRRTGAVMAKTLRRLTHRTVAAAWESWHLSCQDAKRQRMVEQQAADRGFFEGVIERRCWYVLFLVLSCTAASNLSLIC